MIHPSYVDLMQVVNKGVEEGETPVINSRIRILSENEPDEEVEEEIVFEETDEEEYLEGDVTAE